MHDPPHGIRNVSPLQDNVKDFTLIPTQCSMNMSGIQTWLATAQISAKPKWA